MRRALWQEYAAATPYQHAVLQPLCDDGAARRCFEELKNNMTSTFKETDLFKARGPPARRNATRLPPRRPT